MKERYIQMTFRKGKPVAAYLHLPRASGVKAARTERLGEGILVDFSADGTPIGVEITAPGRVSAERINAVLEKLGLARAAPEELAPLSHG